MNTLTTNTMALLIGALFFVPLSPSTARADDDDWEDRWEDRWEFEDDWDDDYDDDWRWRRGWYRDRPNRYWAYDSSPRYYRSYRGEVYPYYYPERRVYRYYDRGPRYYYYDGRVHAGPADVYYGRHGEVRVGPLHFDW